MGTIYDGTGSDDVIVAGVSASAGVGASTNSGSTTIVYGNGGNDSSSATIPPAA